MNKLSKKLFFYLMLCMGVFLYNANAQCATPPTPTITTYTAYGGQCSDQYAQYSQTDSNSTFSSGIIKLPFDYVLIQKTITVTTVGTTEYRGYDTYLSLYDSKGTTDTSDDVLLAYNDDDPDCDCLQSTITYTNSAYSPWLINPYVIVTKTTKSGGVVSSSCDAIDFNVKIKYNTMAADFDDMLPITDPVNLSCLGSGSTIQFSNKPRTSSGGDTYTYSWSSDAPDIISINSSGLATILANSGGTSIRLLQYKNGILQSCVGTKSVFITYPVTSTITASN